MTSLRIGLLPLVLLCIWLWPGRAAAQDRFEIQVYDSQTAAPATVGMEMHVNFNVVGTAAPSADGEMATNHALHVTLEPHLGVARWLELGGYMQMAFLPGDLFEWAGVKGRVKLRVPVLLWGVLGLALNMEISAVPAEFEANVWGSELRPIIDVNWRWLYASVNPIIDIDIEGALAGKPQFQPAVKLALRTPMPTGYQLQFGPEYYAGLGPFSGFLPLSQQVHRLFATADFAHGGYDVNFGVGHGFAYGERWIIKMIFGVDFPK